MVFLCMHAKLVGHFLTSCKSRWQASSLPPVPHGKPSHISVEGEVCNLHGGQSGSSYQHYKYTYGPSNSTSLGILAYKYTCVSTTSLHGICCSIICNGKRLNNIDVSLRLWLVHMVEHYTTVKRKEENALY